MTGPGQVVQRALALGAELGFASTTAEVLHGGEENHAVRLHRSGGDVVVRFSRDSSRQVGDPFDVEEWCSRAARASGVATPAVLARARVGDTSVIVHRFAPGRRPAADDLDAWRALGRVASVLERIDTATAPPELFSRFGRDLDRAWGAHLEHNVAALGPEDPLLDLGVYPRSAQPRLREVLQRLATRGLAQGLVHGDLSVRNQLRGEDGFVVLDWGAARAGPTPWTDLERIRRWRLAGDRQTPVSGPAWRAVLEGAGLDAAAEDVVEEVGVAHALDVVRWALERRPDRLRPLAEESRRTLARVLAAR